jgi:hypothetical protein
LVASCYLVEQNVHNGVIWVLAKNIPKRILTHQNNH